MQIFKSIKAYERYRRGQVGFVKVNINHSHAEAIVLPYIESERS